MAQFKTFMFDSTQILLEIQRRFLDNYQSQEEGEVILEVRDISEKTTSTLIQQTEKNMLLETLREYVFSLSNSVLGNYFIYLLVNICYYLTPIYFFLLIFKIYIDH